MISLRQRALHSYHKPWLASQAFQKRSVQLSMLSSTISELLKSPPPVNTAVVAKGHIKAIRSFKNIGFIDISDGSISQTLNVVFNDPDTVFGANKFSVGQSVQITGSWIESQGKQAYELQYDPENPSHALSILGNVPESYPIQKKSQTLQFLRTLPTLRHRTSTLASVMRFRSHIETLIAAYFERNSFVKVSPPLITSSDCEGAGEQFKVDPLHKKDPKEQFFGKDAYLTVSAQLHLEVLALSLNRAWTLSPCFRAEDSNTNRHLSEFWMLEAEICYVDSVQQLTSFVEHLVRSLVLELKNEGNGPGTRSDLLDSRFSKSEVQTINDRWSSILSENPWPTISYIEALEIINKVKNKGRSKGRLVWGDSIQTEHEKWLAGSHFQSPVFITDYPSEQKPFYMPKSKGWDPEKPTVACFDLIVPEIGELVGGSLREHDYDKLVKEMQNRDMNLDAMQWYLSTRENGSVPHGGFGMGFERLVAYLAGVENIRDISAFPRAPNVCSC